MLVKFIEDISWFNGITSNTSRYFERSNDELLYLKEVKKREEIYIYKN